MRGSPHDDHRTNTGLTPRPRITREWLESVQDLLKAGGPIGYEAAQAMVQEILALWEWQDVATLAMKKHEDAMFEARGARRRQEKNEEEARCFDQQAQDALAALKMLTEHM